MPKGKFCVNCGVSSMLLCSRCNDSYCSSECQKMDWMRHRPICFKMPNLVPDLDSLELNMLTSLSTANTGRAHCNDSGVNMTVASTSQTRQHSEIAPPLLPAKQQATDQQSHQSETVQAAPLPQRSAQQPSNHNDTTDSEAKPKPVNRSQSLKTPIPTSVLKLQPASIYGKKPAEPKKVEPPKPLKIADIPPHKWAATDKIKVVPLGANEGTLTLRENNAYVDEAYERITKEVEAYCKDKKGCGYKPVEGEIVLALFGEEWYRAEVMDFSDDGVIVRYIDFGNLEIVQETDMIKMPNKVLNEFEVYAKDFIVDNFPAGELTDKQQEILGSDSFTITDCTIDDEGFLHCKVFGF